MRTMTLWMQRFYRWIPPFVTAVLALNGLLNVISGALIIFRFAGFEPAQYVPDYLQLPSVQQTSGIISILLGIFLIFLSKGLYERRRRSWAWALALLSILTANNIARGTIGETAYFSIFLVLLLVVFYRYFDQTEGGISPYSHLLAWGSMLFALAYGVVGAYFLRTEFSGIETWIDAFYYTVVTYSTVGYGDILPQTRDAKIFTVSMIAIGLTSFVTALTVLVGPMIENRVKGMLKIMTKLQHAANHVVVCGYSSVAEVLIRGLQEQNIPYVIIEEKESLAQKLRENGHRVVLEDPTRLDVLLEAGLEHSRALVCALPEDAANLLVVLTARNYRDQEKKLSFKIIARVEKEENLAKVQKAGADEVISPASLAGKMMLDKLVIS